MGLVWSYDSFSKLAFRIAASNLFYINDFVRLSPLSWPIVHWMHWELSAVPDSLLTRPDKFIFLNTSSNLLIPKLSHPTLFLPQPVNPTQINTRSITLIRPPGTQPGRRENPNMKPCLEKLWRKKFQIPARFFLTLILYPTLLNLPQILVFPNLEKQIQPLQLDPTPEHLIQPLQPDPTPERLIQPLQLDLI